VERLEKRSGVRELRNNKLIIDIGQEIIKSILTKNNSSSSSSIE